VRAAGGPDPTPAPRSDRGPRASSLVNGTSDDDEAEDDPAADDDIDDHDSTGVNDVDRATGRAAQRYRGSERFDRQLPDLSR
jgi:hypothetical protein